jgi:hypothetical protein
MLRALTLLFALILAAPALAGRVALVIGNADYASAGRLANAGNDTADMADRLTGLGFEVFAGQNLTRAQMLALLDQFSDALSPEDLALFFYAGHGVQIGAENYIIPVDAVATDEVTLTAASVKLQTILRTMELRADRRIVILDACRNNPFVEKLASRGVGEVPKGLARVEAGVGSYIAFSTQPQNVALDGTGRNSPFTTALLAHIGDPASDIHAMMRRVRADVVATTGSVQVPWENSSLVEEVFLAAGAQASPDTLTKLAEALPEQSQFRLMGSGGTCYLRRYTVDHLQSHPQQRVSAIGLVLYPGGDQTLATLYVRIRPDQVQAMGSAYCDQDGEGQDCLMEGDAGRFSLTGAKNGALRLSVAPRGISLEGMRDFITLSGTSGDDRVFLLPPLGDADCARLSAAGQID